MRFALLYEIERSGPAGGSLYDGVEQALEQVVLAEALGFHAVWALEPRLLDPCCDAAAPEVWLAAVARRTERIRIGYGVALLPIESHHPIRSAELAAVLDVLSGGRLDLAAGCPPADSSPSASAASPSASAASPSASAASPSASPPSPSVSPQNWEEVLRTIPQMWTRDPFEWQSERLEVPARNVLPKPVQAPHPPLWLAGSDRAAAVLAGEWGLGFLQLPTGGAVDVGDQARAHREGAARCEPATERVGAFVHDRFAATTPMVCGENDAVVGGAERCSESIRRLAAQGVDELVFHVPPGLSHDDVCDSLRRFGREVLPRFTAAAAPSDGEPDGGRDGDRVR